MEKRLRLFLKINTNYEQQILQNPQVGEASKFYFACRNGDIDTVKQMLPTIPYDRLNQLEPNGSTPLHAATYFGHLEIVHLLVHEYGCQRYQQNRHGLTAYEEAQTDVMRQLYHRPSNKNRFFDESNDIQQIFEILSSSRDKIEIDENDNDDDVAKPNQQWLTGYQTNEEIKKQLDGLNGVKTLLQSRLGRYIMKQAMKCTLGKKDCGYNEEEYAYVANKIFGGEALHKIIDEHITVDHPEYKHCCHLLNEYIQQGTIESLLTLYSMETPFYHRLSIKINPLAFPLFMNLSNLKQRYYQGESYRGVKMTRDELSECRWALKNKDSVMSTVKFASTSIVRHVAERFVTQSPSLLDKISVLLIFYFSQPCDTAINLGKIPEYQLPCISNFENEHEVLVAPRTFFKVKRIETNSLNGQHIIYLENICGKHKTILGTLQFFLKQELKNRHRH